MTREQSEPFLRVPPFPGAKVHGLGRRRSGPVEVLSDGEVDELIAEIERLRVGGDYWKVRGDGEPRLLTASPEERRARFRREVHEPFEYVDPFTNEPISLAEAIRLCGFWRSLIDSRKSWCLFLRFSVRAKMT